MLLYNSKCSSTRAGLLHRPLPYFEVSLSAECLEGHLSFLSFEKVFSLLFSYFFFKIKDLRNRGDENAKILQAHLQEGIEPPKGLRHDFQDLLLLVRMFMCI